MSKHTPASFSMSRAAAIPGPRGIVSVRADATPSVAEIKALIDGIVKNFEDFKKENDTALKAATKDLAQADKVDRINAAIEKQQKTLDDFSAQLAAVKTGGGGKLATPEVKAHADAFAGYFRKGADAGLRELEVKASLTSKSDPDGGYLVPREMETQMDRVLGTLSAMRGLATVRTVSGSGYKKPVNQSGAASGWVGEIDSRPQTATPQIAVLDFPVMELYANPYATQTLLDDSAVDIAAWLADEVSIEFAEKEGAAFIGGDGVAKPYGLLSYTTIANASYVWGKIGFVVTGAAADFAADPDGADAIIDLQGALKTGYQNNASFLCTRPTATRIRKLRDGNDNYVWQPGLQAGAPATLFGRPILTDDNMDELGAGKFALAYGDFKRAYLIVDRIGIRVLRDPFSAKPYVQFYTTKRVGGGVQNFEAVKLLKCSV